MTHANIVIISQYVASVCYYNHHFQTEREELSLEGLKYYQSPVYMSGIQHQVKLVREGNLPKL